MYAAGLLVLFYYRGCMLDLACVSTDAGNGAKYRCMDRCKKTDCRSVKGPVWSELSSSVGIVP